MTIEELRQVLHQLHLDYDADPQLIYVFYQTPDGLVNNFSISMQHARQRNRQPMTQTQLADLMEQYPAAADSKIVAVEHPTHGLTRWIDSAEVCTRLNVCPHTLRRWVKMDRLHPAHLGKRIYYDPDEVEAFLRSNMRQENGRLDRVGTLPPENET